MKFNILKKSNEIKFILDLNKIHYGNLICENTGLEYQSNYRIRKVWCLKWLNLSVQNLKIKV